MRTSLTVEFAKLSDEAKLPTQGSPQAAGWDLYALEETIVERRKSSMIKTGLAVAIPEGWEGQIRCRSSLGKKGMIMPNGIGTIDREISSTGFQINEELPFDRSELGGALKEAIGNAVQEIL